MLRSPLLSLLLVLCGCLGGYCTFSLVPAELRSGIPGLHRHDYRLERTASTSFEVSEAKWFSVPFLYADFDLTMDVELGEAMDLDVVLRLVEPRILGRSYTQFHGRFTVLRLSTNGAGPAWRTRDEALFAPRSGGAELAAGHTATVWIEARGRSLRANVAGKWYPWVVADDHCGQLALVARGGQAALQRLVIRDLGLGRGVFWSWWFWLGLGAALGLAAAGAAALARAGLARTVGLGVIVAGLPAATVLRAATAPLQLPEPTTMAGHLLAPAIAVLIVAGLRFWPLRVAAAAGLLAMVLFGAPWREHRQDDWQLDEVFGPASGQTPCEALAQRVRGPFEIHDVAPATHRVFLLGGQLLYDRATPTEHLEPLLAGDLRVLLQHKVDVPCLPTVDGHSRQQWQLFERFFGGYRPAVIVFGVPRAEAAPGPDGQPRSSPEQLAATLAAARSYCDSRRIRLVLFTEHELPEELHAALRGAAAGGLPLVVAGPGEAPAAISRRLAEAVAPLLQAPVRR
ncbi:MAG: hypothetical protein FJ265_01755 [Planctomycetes bacterium]|nr:hypothetical protein [Planctomycetota bacterium]